PERGRPARNQRRKQLGLRTERLRSQGKATAGLRRLLLPQPCRPMKASRLVGSLFLFSNFLVALRGAEVTSLGAKGDGRTDDTAAIQRAVDAGGSIRFPAGTFRLTRTVTIDLDRTGFV